MARPSALSAAADLEPGFSGGTACYPDTHRAAPAASHPRRVPIPPPPPPIGAFFYDDLSDEEPQHFLDACFLCKKPLSRKDDIFMYRKGTIHKANHIVTGISQVCKP